MTFGLWLRDQRQARNMDQKAAALSLGFSRRHYKDVERGKRNPSLKFVYAVYRGWYGNEVPFLRAGYAPNAWAISSASDETLASAWRAFRYVLDWSLEEGE